MKRENVYRQVIQGFAKKKLIYDFFDKPSSKFSSLDEPLCNRWEQNCGIPGTSFGDTHVCGNGGCLLDDVITVLIMLHSNVALLLMIMRMKWFCPYNCTILTMCV